MLSTIAESISIMSRKPCETYAFRDGASRLLLRKKHDRELASPF